MGWIRRAWEWLGEPRPYLWLLLSVGFFLGDEVGAMLGCLVLAKLDMLEILLEANKGGDA